MDQEHLTGKSRAGEAALTQQQQWVPAGGSAPQTSSAGRPSVQLGHRPSQSGSLRGSALGLAYLACTSLGVFSSEGDT